MSLLDRYPRSRRSRRGQALVELAIILPILLAMVGGAVDLARAMQAWLTLESATRNAAEFVATQTSITTSSAALTAAKKVVCEETTTMPGWTAGSGGNPCNSPTVLVPAFTISPTASGATAANPIATARVTTSVQFRTLVPWPLLPNNSMTLKADRTYSIVRGR